MKTVTKKKTAIKKIVNKEVSYLDKLTAPGRFLKRPDGWVRDNLLGLDWGPSSTKCMNYAEAEKHCASVGGRLPTIRELHSLVDYSQYKPAINKEIFADTKIDDYYWTATAHPYWQNSAWVVDFSYGYVSSNSKDDAGCVRPDRASQ